MAPTVDGPDLGTAIGRNIFAASRGSCHSLRASRSELPLRGRTVRGYHLDGTIDTGLTGTGEVPVRRLPSAADSAKRPDSAIDHTGLHCLCVRPQRRLVGQRQTNRPSLQSFLSPRVRHGGLRLRQPSARHSAQGVARVHKRQSCHDEDEGKGEQTAAHGVLLVGLKRLRLFGWAFQRICCAPLA